MDEATFIEGMQETILNSCYDHNLRKKSFDQLYDLVKEQMSVGIHYNNVVEEIPEGAYDSFELISSLCESFGRFLCSPYDIDSLENRLKRLYHLSLECENKIRDHTFDDEKSSVTLYPTDDSMVISAMQLVLEGYKESNGVYLDQEIIKLYDITQENDTSRISELLESIDNYAQGLGYALRKNEDDQVAWELDIFESITYQIYNTRLIRFRDELYQNSARYKIVKNHMRKIYACWNIVNGYLDCAYGEELPSNIQMMQSQILEGMKKNPGVQKRLKLKGDIEVLVPSDIDVYLAGLGLDICINVAS